MWGTPGPWGLIIMCARFIPTHVGNSRLLGMGSVMCGSSPRMWGTLRLRNDLGTGDRFIPTHVGNSPMRMIDFLQVPRFIPTHVGNSVRPDAQCSERSVHPHACGELQLPLNNVVDPSGSSPRMWGTHNVIPHLSPGLRFIPTHVGNSHIPALSCPMATVHPHACGELRVVAWIRRRSVGSSPRMWGTLI